MKIKSFLFGVSTSESSLGNQFRQRRMIFFKEKIKNLPKPLKIIDIGGNEEFWENAGLNNNPELEITVVNLEKFDTSSTNIISVIGDATDLSQYSDKQFDIAFSNSVIEHLYTEANQAKMAKESVRVGKFHYIQTPNKYFIIEPHYLLPFFNFLPKSIQYFILTKTPLSRGKKWSKEFARQYIDEILLISENSYKKFFPSSKIWKEKVFGLTKSFVAHNF